MVMISFICQLPAVLGSFISAGVLVWAPSQDAAGSKGSILDSRERQWHGWCMPTWW